jgi:hypothetical protein
MTHLTRVIMAGMTAVLGVGTWWWWRRRQHNKNTFEQYDHSRTFKTGNAYYMSIPVRKSWCDFAMHNELSSHRFLREHPVTFVGVRGHTLVFDSSYDIYDLYNMREQADFEAEAYMSDVAETYFTEDGTMRIHIDYDRCVITPR